LGRTYAHNIGIIKITLVPDDLDELVKKGGRSLYGVIRVSLQRVTKLFNIDNNNFIVSKNTFGWTISDDSAIYDITNENSI